MTKLRSVGVILSVDGAAADKLSASLQSIHPLCINIHPFRNSLSITGLFLGLMDAIHMLFALLLAGDIHRLHSKTTHVINTFCNFGTSCD